MISKTSKIIEPMVENIKDDLISSINENIKTELELLKVEINSSLISSKDKIDEITKNTQKTKKEMWNKALKKANGDEEKAIKIYSKISI